MKHITIALILLIAAGLTIVGVSQDMIGTDSKNLFDYDIKTGVVTENEPALLAKKTKKRRRRKCPVIGNKSTKVYRKVTGQVCFPSEKAARKAGYELEGGSF